MKEQVTIIGGGFAGLSALQVFSKHSDKFEVTLIDKRPNQEFLPLLPDIIGNNLPPAALQTNLQTECAKAGANFVEEEVIEIQPQNSKVITNNTERPYTYLLIAAGSVTNFYDHSELIPHAYEFKSTQDATGLRNKVLNNNERNIVICGGGYTGIEVANACKRALNKAGINKQITIANIKSRLCPMLEEKMSAYVMNELKNSEINIELNDTVTGYSNQATILKSGKKIDDSLLVWVSGVKAPDFISTLGREKMPQSRLPVNKYLQFYDKIFIAGDCTAFTHNNNILRMSVQNALTQGKHAAKNIIHHASNKSMETFKPFDPGYVLPIYCGNSCGKIMGIDMYGKLPMLLHYFMCTIKSSTMHNRFKVLKNYFH